MMNLELDFPGKVLVLELAATVFQFDAIVYFVL